MVDIPVSRSGLKANTDLRPARALLSVWRNWCGDGCLRLCRHPRMVSDLRHRFKGYSFVKEVQCLHFSLSGGVVLLASPFYFKSFS